MLWCRCSTRSSQATWLRIQKGTDQRRGRRWQRGWEKSRSPASTASTTASTTGPPSRPAQPESPAASTATPPPAATATDFWTAVYGRDPSQEDGRLLLLDRADNDYGRALVWLAQQPA